MHACMRRVGRCELVIKRERREREGRRDIGVVVVGVISREGDDVQPPVQFV